MHAIILRNVAVLAATLVLTAGCMATARAVSQRTPEPAKIFDSADANGDGVITREEFHTARERLFTRLDRNGDGYIDKDDAPSRPLARHKAQDRLTDLVSQLDKDGDGRISKAEFVEGPTPLFDRADTDHNGELSRDEIAAIKDKIGKGASQ